MDFFGCTGGSYRTSDGADLFYLENGSGPTVILLPSSSQTAAMFKGQLTGLSDRHRMIALDHRGHGESSKVDHGPRSLKRAILLKAPMAQSSLGG